MTEFSKRIYETVKSIPAGRVMTYGQVARMTGNPRGARGVGFALHANPEPETIPCHRVVFGDGSLAPAYVFGGEEAQRKLLLEEKVVFLEDGRVDMERCCLF